MNELKKDIPKIAVIITVNDIEYFHGGSNNGLKKQISYFNQFLILYESIKSKWIGIDFTFDIYLLHSIEFSKEKKEILKLLDVNVILVNYSKHKTKIRPMAYFYDIKCDFRLVLDVDMLALKKPVFNFDCDFQAMYGGNKYTKKQWVKICNILDCKMPIYPVLNKKNGNYNNWSIHEMNLYQSGNVDEKLFPYFNNGAILINNNITIKFIEKWEKARDLYTVYVKKESNIDIDLEGQDVIGVVLNDVSDNWEPFEIGFNFPLQESFDISNELMKVKAIKEISLVHYINLNKNFKWSNIIFIKFLRILNFYYKVPFIKRTKLYTEFLYSFIKKK